MTVSKTYLPPSATLLAGATEFLAAKARASRLGHVLVVVPTARAGQALAARLKSAIPDLASPPRIFEPFELAAGGVEKAPESVLRAAFMEFLGDYDAAARWPHLFIKKRLPPDEAIAFYGQLSDIWRPLSGSGLTFGDVVEAMSRPGAVASLMERAKGDEKVRWQELASLETAFFAHLEKAGVVHPAKRLRDVRLGIGAPELPPGVEEIVLPALVDPVPLLFDVLSRWQGQNPQLKVSALIHADESDAALFDDFGRPLAERWTGPAAPLLDLLPDGSIIRAATPCDLAREAVASSSKFGIRSSELPQSRTGLPKHNSELRTPNSELSVAVADPALHGELEAAFLDSGVLLHNPQMFRLSASSLGAIALNILAVRLSDGGIPFRPFAALMRSDDVLNAVSASLAADADEILQQMSRYANESLPEFLDTAHPHLVSGRFNAFAAAARLLAGWLTDTPETPFPAFAKSFIAKIRAAQPDGAERVPSAEYAAAAAELETVLDSLAHPAMPALPPDAISQLARAAIGEAAYSLEPGPDAVRTYGWLEIAWCDSPRIILAGLHEGCVPEAMAGHSFLPDSLRAALGIPCNATRLARDAFLFREMLACRKRGDVSVFLSQTSDRGDLLKPSRLLFRLPPAALADRAGRLFDAPPAATPPPPRSLADGMRLDLAKRYEFPNRSQDCIGSVSPSSIDAYLRCPFTWSLRFVEGLDRQDDRTRLEKTDFGNVAHAALENFANEEIAWANAHNNIARTDEDEIRRQLEIAFDAAAARYSGAPASARLQLDSLKERLMDFAPIQAHWAREGWRPWAAELRLRDRSRKKAGKVFLFGPYLPYINGSIDRIDYHPVHGFRIIDYKTWDSADFPQLMNHLAAGGTAQTEFAKRFGYPLFKPSPKSRSLRRLLTIQVPLYALALEALMPQQCQGRVNDACYLVLGKNRANVRLWGSSHETPFDVESSARVVLADLKELSLATARRAVESMAQNVFWPPAPTEEWKRDYSGLFVFSPEADLAPQNDFDADDDFETEDSLS